MSDPGPVLLVSDNNANVQGVREALASSEQQFALQHIERVRTALARIAGGGLTVILLDVSGDPEGKGREALAALQAGAPDVPLIVLCASEDEPAVKQLVKETAILYLVRPKWRDELARRILAATAVLPDTGSGTKGTVIAITGAKGGVGATTVAVNVASLLASSYKVILAELRPPIGTLCHFFRPHRAARSLQDLLALSRAEYCNSRRGILFMAESKHPGLGSPVCAGTGRQRGRDRTQSDSRDTRGVIRTGRCSDSRPPGLIVRGGSRRSCECPTFWPW